MKQFVDKDSIMREIWGSSDTLLFVFAGASAEFSLNKSVDWLYFTGKLPDDPIGRLFSTVQYSQKIILSNKKKAFLAIDEIVSIHKSIEDKRGISIPEWAYRDVLYILIYYSISAYELLHQKLNKSEKTEIFSTFLKLGERMKLKDLPNTFEEWECSRENHLTNDLEASRFTEDLYKRFKEQLGNLRFLLLLETQKALVPTLVKNHLNFTDTSLLNLLVPIYKLLRKYNLERRIKSVLLPSKYRSRIQDMDLYKPVKHSIFQFKYQSK